MAWQGGMGPSGVGVGAGVRVAMGLRVGMGVGMGVGVGVEVVLGLSGWVGLVGAVVWAIPSGIRSQLYLPTSSLAHFELPGIVY